ncbi:MAG: hypothetical protein ACI4EN_00180 [Butyrivibrio sp.]
MKLKERDKNLLVIVIVALVIFLAYFFGFRNITAKKKTVDEEVVKLTATYTNLKLLASQEQQFKEDIEEYNADTENKFNSFDNGYSQQNTIKFLEQIENQTGVWIKSAGLTQTQSLFNFGSVQSSNPERAGQPVYSSDRIGYSTTVNITFVADYDGMKEMIDFVNGYKYRCRIDSLSTSYNSDADLVSGNMSVTMFAITGSDRVFEGPSINNPFFSTPNIFESSIFTPGEGEQKNGENIISDYDVYLTLQSTESDYEALKMGLKSDTTGYSVVTDEDNAVKDITIRVTGEKDNYRISYKVGNKTFPVSNYAEGESFIAGNLLSMLVVSSERTGINDNSGAEVVLINESDMVLYVKVINEDLASPRFNIKSKQGEIVVYED